MSLRLAIIGVGRMGTIHARTLAAHPSVDLAAVVDPASEHASALADEIGTAYVATPAELYAAFSPEAVLVASPTLTHPTVVREALSAGRHVLCEKPLALDVAVGGELDELAKGHQRVLQVGFWRRFSPPWVAAKRLVDKGAIGRPLMIRLSQWDASPPPPAFCDPEVSGGLAIDCGVHEYDLAEWLTGSAIATVTARNLPVVDPAVAQAGDVDNLVAMLDLENGAVATVDLSRNAGYGDDVRTEILGESGAIFIELLPTGRALLATDDGVSVVPGSEADDPMESALVAQVQVFARAVSGQEIELPDARTSNRAVSVGRAVQRAAGSGTSITL